MLLQQIHIKNFRNLDCSTKLEFSPHINIFYGGNGTGKTSLLESIYYLALGRSFKSNQLNSVINIESNHLRIEGTYSNLANSIIKVNAFKDRDGNKIIKIGETLSNNAELIALAPTQLINDESSNLIFKGPELRRKFIDWLAFYSSNNYRLEWRQFNKILQQRNQILKQSQGRNFTANSKLLSNLEELFVKFAEKLTASRIIIWNKFVKVLQQQIDDLELSQDISLEVKFYPGWQGELSQALAVTRSLDLKLGFTSAGAHKSDLKFIINKKSMAKEVLSRGQGKLLAFIMILARSRFIQQINGHNFTSVLLIDDLCAELDNHNIIKVMQQLYNFKDQLQIFITSTDFFNISKTVPLTTSKFFEVVQGQIREAKI